MAMIGERLSHYRITSKLGEGGMGEVYRAHDERLDRDVAIKVLPESVSENPDRLARFEREAKAVAKLAHPSILDVYELGEHEGEVFMVTEFLEGETLRERLAGGTLGWRKATEIGAAIADGLAAAHEAGIVHRDLKPSQVPPITSLTKLMRHQPTSSQLSWVVPIRGNSTRPLPGARPAGAPVTMLRPEEPPRPGGCGHNIVIDGTPQVGHARHARTRRCRRSLVAG
jgi:hypothetical protein